MIVINKDEYEQIKRYEEDTLTTYDIRKIEEDGLEHYYIGGDNLVELVLDVIVEYNKKVEELSDIQYQLDNYYTKKREEFE